MAGYRNVMQTEGGIFTVSLDFELYWGMRDVISHERYYRNLSGTPAAVLAMLELFEKYNIHATWATVGFIFFGNREALLQNMPEPLPSYKNSAFDLYRYIWEEKHLEKISHFAPELIKEIAKRPHQEIATHTFSHYYCLEEGQDADSFSADIHKAISIAKSHTGREVRSIVFPRNQYNPDYMQSLRRYGIRTFRGNEPHPVYDAVHWEGRGLKRRLVKLLDTYINLTGYHTYDPAQLNRIDGVLDIPSSRFLRPFTPVLSPLEGLKLRRIKSAMTHAAREGEIFHLWWHPHNFGRYSRENLIFLEKILRHYRSLQQQYGMRSMTMAEIEALFG